MDQSKAMYRKSLRDQCRHVRAHGVQQPAEVLLRIANWCAEQSPEFDIYGSGTLIETFESKVANLLGFPAARFMPSGKMAQNIALRVWSDRSRNPHFGMHPTSHLELHEARAYEHLFSLRATLVGPRDTPLLARHFEEVPEDLSALLTELPIREAGGQLPTWEQLTELKAAAQKRDTRLHLDGARLWETAPFYGRPYDEICAGFDSAYVSFYKGIGALSGAMLLGPQDFIDEAAVWQKRCGGELYTLLPNVASAAMMFDQRIARMTDYHEHALAIAQLINNVPGMVTLPRVPQTNMMHVLMSCSPETALEARDKLAAESGVWLIDGVRQGEAPESSRFEWSMGEAACAIEIAEFQTLIHRFSKLLSKG